MPNSPTPAAEDDPPPEYFPVFADPAEPIYFQPPPPAAYSWRPPRQSNPSRRFAARSVASARGMMVVGWKEGDPVNLMAESYAEYKVASVAAMRPDTAQIEAQPRPIRYLHDGKGRTHTFDYLIVKDTGERAMIYVKPFAKASRDSVQYHFATVAAQVSPVVAGSIHLWTDRTFSKAEIANAIQIRMAYRVREAEADAAVAREVANMVGMRQAGNIRDATRLGGRAFKAIVRAIGDGLLEVVGDEMIAPGTWLRRVAKLDVEPRPDPMTAESEQCPALPVAA